jgi:prepilin-type processing-associated H-X9-DG protein
VIEQTAYTLFADGSVETPLPEGVLRFASIEEFLGHLEKREG